MDTENFLYFKSEIEAKNMARISLNIFSPQKSEITKKIIYKLFNYLRATEQFESKTTY